MDFEEEFQLATKIGKHDGYRPKPIWEEEAGNTSTYDNVWMDSQCSVPINRN